MEETRLRELQNERFEAEIITLRRLADNLRIYLVQEAGIWNATDQALRGFAKSLDSLSGRLSSIERALLPKLDAVDNQLESVDINLRIVAEEIIAARRIARAKAGRRVRSSRPVHKKAPKKRKKA